MAIRRRGADAARQPYSGAEAPSLGRALGFAIGSIVPFSLSPWPGPLKYAAIVIALAMIGLKITLYVGRLCVHALSLLSPANSQIVNTGSPRSMRK